MSQRPKAVVLLSGGLDSATTLAIAQGEGFACHALTVRYGQRHAVEIARASELAVRMGVTAHRVVDVDLTFAAGSALTDAGAEVPRGRSPSEIGAGIPTTYVPARNTVFLALGLAWAESLGARDLFLGVNAVDYSGYPDCRPAFIAAFENLARLATRAADGGAAYRIRAPLLHLGKGEIVEKAFELDVDVARTLSCYDPDPGGAPCGRCDACILRRRGFRDAGRNDPALEGAGE
jgi:7-cyano-7-deazaguanine synthase